MIDALYMLVLYLNLKEPEVYADKYSGFIRQLKSLPVGINMFSGFLATDYTKLFAAPVAGIAPMNRLLRHIKKQTTKGVSA